MDLEKERMQEERNKREKKGDCHNTKSEAYQAYHVNMLFRAISQLKVDVRKKTMTLCRTSSS
jgi:phosphodiesterase/alkaline phosphatase D-like protein